MFHNHPVYRQHYGQGNYFCTGCGHMVYARSGGCRTCGTLLQDLVLLDDILMGTVPWQLTGAPLMFDPAFSGFGGTEIIETNGFGDTTVVETDGFGDTEIIETDAFGDTTIIQDDSGWF